ncbi:MAG: hypothetical protein DIKNOCCD_02532 [bacterium]|nr:hypothetical protein [bacterium]
MAAIGEVGFNCFGQSQDIEQLVSGKSQAGNSLPGFKLERNHPHADQVAAVDAFETLGDCSPDAEQAWPLGGPVPRGSCAIFLSGQNHQRHPLFTVLHGGIVNGHLSLVRQVKGKSAFHPRHHLVAQTDVGESAAHHDFMVPTAGAE